jgi:hypothetical protein
MTRLEIINYLIEQHSLNSYLEIGVSYGEVLNGCIAQNKIGVDPNYEIYKGYCSLFHGTSNEFFKELAENAEFDIIFIDGLHEAEQVLADIKNSLTHLSPNGYIVLHDCNPPTKWHTRPYSEFLKDTNTNWNGTVYKGFIEAYTQFGLPHYTVDDDWGVGILQKFPATKGIPNYKFNYDWDIFDKNRRIFLNLISEEEFKERFRNA